MFSFKMKQIYKLLTSIFLLTIFFASSVFINKTFAFSGTIYLPNGNNGNVCGYGCSTTSTVTISQQDIDNAVPAPSNSSYTCGPITEWVPYTVLYYTDNNNVNYQQAQGTTYPITQTQGITSVAWLANNTTYQGVKEIIRFDDGNSCFWTDSNSSYDPNTDTYTSSSPLISLNDLPASFNYPQTQNGNEVTINSIPSVSIDTGRTYAYLGTFTIPNMSTLSYLSSTVDYGDGSGTQPLTLNATSFNLHHRYSTAGTYIVTIKITDSNSGNVITKTANVSVSDNSDWTWDSNNQILSNDSKTSYTVTFNPNSTEGNSYVYLSWCGSDTNSSNTNTLRYPTGFSNHGLRITDALGNIVYNSSSYQFPPGSVSMYVDCMSGVVKIDNTTIVSGLTSSGGTYNTISLGATNRGPDTGTDDDSPYSATDPNYSGFITVCSPLLVNCQASNPTYSLSGTVYNDANQNGIQDSGETGYANATVTLDNGQSTTTDSNGNYTFSGLEAGTYIDTLTVPSGYNATTTNPVSVPLAANTTQNFGIAPATALVTAINAGGDTEGSYVADTDSSGGSTYSSNASVDMSGVDNPAPQAVYQTVRYGNFSYTIPNLTPNETYTVRLHFNEVYWGTDGSDATGKRIFNVSVNGTTALTNFDIFDAAGGANKAIVEQLPATADSNGNITLQFSSVVDNAMVNGIELYSGTLPSPTPTPTPTPVTSEAINSGGNTSGSFIADVHNFGGSTYTSHASVDTSGVTNPAPESVYQSVRYGNFSYTIPTYSPSTSYHVRLHFNELYWGTDLSGNQGGDGSRVFNVAINGTQALNNFDIYQTAGGANKALVEDFDTTTDANGRITIQFTTVTDNAMVNGIEISKN